MGFEWIAPVITGVFAVVLTFVGGILARRGSKVGSLEQRAPDVQEMWAQQESDRRMRQVTEDMWWSLRRAFQSYYRRVTSALMQLSLTQEQAKAFELTHEEVEAIEARPPKDDPLK